MPRWVGFVLVVWGLGLLSFLSYAQATYQPGKEYILGGISFAISGLDDVPTEVLHALTGLRPGERIRIPGDQTRDALKRLWQQDLFVSLRMEVAEVRGDTVYLRIVGRGQPRIAKYTIVGVPRGQAEEIAERIGSLKGKAFTQSLQTMIQARVQHYYQEKGFLYCRTRVVVKDTDEAGRLILAIHVHRGRKVRIHEIDFVGNERFSDRRLRMQLKKTKVYPRFWVWRRFSFRELLCGQDKQCLPEDLIVVSRFLRNKVDYWGQRVRLTIFHSSRYQEEQFQADLRNMLEFYYRHGFRNARVLKDTVMLRADSTLWIRIWIDEGRQYYFGRITWTGNHLYSDSFLTARLGIQSGEVYNRDRLHQRLFGDPAGTDVASLYMDQGYLFFNAVPREVRIRNDTIDIEIRIYEGPQATIQQVYIQGNTKTHDHVIRRELYTDPGNIFSRRDVIRSQQRLASLNLFDPEQLKVQPEPRPQTGEVDLRYEVTERASDQVELSAGYGNRMLVGTLGLILNNFSFRELVTGKGWDPLPAGDAQRLSIRAQSNYYGYRALTVSVSDPWFGGRKPHSFTTTFYYNVFQGFAPVVDSLPSKQRTIGVNCSWGFRLRFPDDYFMLFLSLEYQQIHLVNSAYFSSLLTSGTVNNAFLELKLTRNSVDQPLFPRQGAQITLTWRLTPPYSLLFPVDISPELPPEERYRWLEYYKWKVDAEWYLPLDFRRKFVGKIRFSFGLMGGYQPALGAPPFERFDLGGDGFSNFYLYGKEVVSLRGYNPFLLNARAFQKLSLELRYPIVLSPMSTIFVLAFAEGGNAWSDPARIQLFDLYRSVGVGVRFLLPMVGLMGFDFGIGLDVPYAPPPEKWTDYLRAPYSRVSIILGFEPY